MKNETVLAFGTFDLLHEGHRFYLREAKKLGGKLIVVVARDATVEKVKGKKPLHGEKERLEAVRALPFVDEAILGNALEGAEKYEIVKQLKPDVIALGYDQKVDENKFKEIFNGKIARIEAFQKEKFNSSKLRKHLER